MSSLDKTRANSHAPIARRELLRVGGLSTLGLTLPMLLQSQQSRGATGGMSPSFGRAKNVIYLWLQGGPPQHETFDPKPDAPAEIRGEFQPIQTNVPGIQISELLPRTAACADKLAIVRSICTQNDLHDASGYWVLTGYPYLGQQSRQISPTDWPYLGSVIKRLKPSETAPALTSVWLPDVMRLNDNVMPAGQTAGFLGSAWEPHRLVCDPSASDFQVEGLTLPGEISLTRLSDRQRLLSQVNLHLDALEKQAAVRDYTRHSQEAIGLLASGQGRTAFDLNRETPELRERYGLNKWGQSLILARRLVEAGARLVHVNWPRDPGDEAVSNPLWDTHAQNADRLQNVLCPIFDVGFTALLDDLQQRGLLDETLVVAIGEFGRTPKINNHGGRDHWGHVFSFALAGAGISGGQVYGSSDRHGAYPRDRKLEPQDLTATIVHLLGIDHGSTFTDATGRPFHITKGEPLAALLGDSPATSARVASAGNLALVPGYTRDLLLNRSFEGSVPLIPVGTSQRLKGWQASPVTGSETSPALNVQLLRSPAGIPRTGHSLAAIGYDLTNARGSSKLAANATGMLVQEVRNPRAGTYTATIHVAGQGTEQDLAEFHKNFRCRLVLFGYQELTKNALKGRREFASVEFKPALAKSAADYQAITLSQKLRSQESGASEIEMGVGLAILVERTTPGELTIPAGSKALVQIDDVDLKFVPRPRNDDVKV
ncbi:MAG: hypothetical protein JWM11_5746 [Planctomycetaceae bacterium]|nr:hypothetical protein [Planctomycetaceae bacterium]